MRFGVPVSIYPCLLTRFVSEAQSPKTRSADPPRLSSQPVSSTHLPWALPQGFHFQNFIDAFNKANLGAYFFNSVLVTALALALLLVVALPASYVLSRFKFRGRRVLSVAFMGGLFINVNYIVVPIFLMLVDGNKGLASLMESLRVEEGSPVYNLFGNGFFLNNHFMLALVYASTALPRSLIHI